MDTATSADGSVIAYQRTGSGTPIIFVPAAFNLRSTFDGVAAELEPDFTTIRYDRRGRGDSTDAIGPDEVDSYRIEHEIEDLAAVSSAVGGSPIVFGFSSGAVLALAAAAAGLPISRLALYEPPFRRGPANPATAGLRDRLVELIKAGKPGEAVSTFQRDGIGLPPELVDQIRRSPAFPALEAIGQTTVYDCTLTAEQAPTEAMRSLAQPTVVLAGAQTWPPLIDGARYGAELIDNATYVEVPGGPNHTIPAAATAQAVRDFAG
jgi:pimeloyl-ACP methyl ester carboxylesterase